MRPESIHAYEFSMGRAVLVQSLAFYTAMNLLAQYSKSTPAAEEETSSPNLLITSKN